MSARAFRYAPLLMFACCLALIALDRSVRAAEQEAVAQVEEAMRARRISTLGHDVTPLSRTEVARLAAQLDPEAYRVTQRAGTEPPFCGQLLHNHEEGSYTCAVCGLPLFSSEDKFDSGSGWPSFTGPVDPEHLTERRDVSHGMVRTEIACARCDAHLGHVFRDGPRPTGLRYCLNSAAMDFVEQGAPVPERSRPVEPSGS
jgi:methionine-R-sulfoxide reductase